MVKWSILIIIGILILSRFPVTAPSGGTLTYGQLETLWTAAGGAANQASVAAAVAMAESGGRAIRSKPNSNGTVDVGYWQINTSHGPGQATLDPMGNARAAVAISKNGTNWRPWCTTWTSGCSGTYDPTAPNTPSGRQYRAQGLTAAPQPVNTAPTAAALSGNPLSADFWTHVIDVVGNWMFYVSLVGVGAVLMFLGTFQLIRDTAAGRATVTGVSRAVQAFVV